MNEFEKYRKNVTSQYGEDGIIEEIFNRLGTENPICIEFGAWDGKYLSNVWNLWNNKGWKALLIEGQTDRANSLSESIKNLKDVAVVNTFVTPAGNESLDNIVKRTAIKANVDLLSIDIDGNDYYIFESLVLKPRVVIIEYNPTIPPHLEIVQSQGEFFGASARALLNLAHSKNYKLAAITDTNLFFVNSDEFEKLRIEELDLARSFPGTHLTYVYSSYDGRLFVDKKPPYLYSMDKLEEFKDKNSTIKSSLKKMLRIEKKGKIKNHPGIETDTEKIPVYIFRD